MARENDEDEKRFFQMDRFYQANGEWYFTTREGVEKGPYVNKEEAEADLLMYLRDINKMDKIGN